MTPVVWTGCYDANWRDLIVPEAFAHPAKMARGLVMRIFDYLQETGALHKGDRVLDPFGGIGTTAIEAASRGVQAVCCELEPRFVALARQNIELHRRDWEAMGRPQPVIVEGDSRYLRTVLSAAAVIVSSPPYADSVRGDQRKQEGPNGRPGDTHGASQPLDTYGNTEGQLGRLTEGHLDAVLSSPPYAVIASGAGGLNTQPTRHAGQQGGRSASSASQDTDQRYGSTDGQLARLPKGAVDAVVSSPPFTQGYSGGGGINVRGYKPGGVKVNYGCAPDKVGERTYQGTGAEREPGNLETLTLGAVEAVVSSPPYEADGLGHCKADHASNDAGRTAVVGNAAKFSQADLAGRDYGDTEGQLGREQGETFWVAAQQVVRECYALLKPGGVAVWVVKAFVREKKLVDFPDDWRRLCEHAGFDTVEEIHASLVHEEVVPGLFEDRVVKRERKSFFRRLAEKKGSPKIDWEVVWIMRKPC